MEYNVRIGKLASILFLIVFGYIAFEKQIQQHFSKCESYLRERESERQRERERERERPAEREGARREVGVLPSLTDT